MSNYADVMLQFPIVMFRFWIKGESHDGKCGTTHWDSDGWW